MLLICWFSLNEESLLKRNGHDCMSSRRSSIHICVRYCSITCSLLNLISDIVITSHIDFREMLNINSIILWLSNLKSLLWSFFRVYEEIMNMLIIYFKHRDSTFITSPVFFWYFWTFFNTFEQFFTRHGNNSNIRVISNNRIWFSTPCLAICK